MTATLCDMMWSSHRKPVMKPYHIELRQTPTIVIDDREYTCYAVYDAIKKIAKERNMSIWGEIYPDVIDDFKQVVNSYTLEDTGTFLHSMPTSVSFSTDTGWYFLKLWIEQQ